MATEEDAASSYLVRLEALRFPNPAGFEKEEPGIEVGMLREEKRLYFAKWKLDLMKKAFPPRMGLELPTESGVGAVEG